MITSRLRVVVFGGAFNPPTLAHEAIIAACLKLPNFDEVWVLPSGNREDKTIELADAARLVMLRSVHAQRFANDPRLHISDFELHLPRPNRTIDTVAALYAAHPAVEFWFAFGDDSYASMPTWPGGVELQASLHRVVLISRGPQVAAAPRDRAFLYIEVPEAYKAISATRVRQALRDGAELDQLVSPPVAMYLRRLP